MAISGIAYGVVGGVGLLLAPFLIATYGLAGYGQILIARIFLPSGAFAILDLGIGETATREVASARAGSRWIECSRALTLLAVVALTLGGGVGIALIAGAGALAHWFKIAPEQQAGFVLLIRVTAALEPFLLLSLVAEGVLRGFERFDMLRTVEVVATVIYGAGALASGLSGLGPNWAAAALVGSLVVRFVLVAVVAAKLLAGQGARARKWDVRTRQEVWRWSATMMYSKVVGILQNQVASPLIGLLLNPAAVGLYDAVVRLPRFARSVFGLVSTTVLPLASRLRSSGDDAATSRLGYYGILGATAATWPAAMVCLVFSRTILASWIGPQVAQYWIYQSAMFVVVMLSVPISFGGSMALADRRATHKLVHTAALQIVVQLPVSIVLVPWLAQWGFVVGQLTAVAVTLPLQYRILHRSLFIGPDLATKIGVVLLVSGSLAAAFALIRMPASGLELLWIGALAAALATFLSAALVLSPSERAQLLRALRSTLVGKR